ncbi:MAG: ABC transporter ATP-binding protein [Deltaproteobacteria bacterium]
MLKLYRYLKPFARSIAAIVVLVFMLVLSELYLPTLMSDIVDIGIVKGDTAYIIRIGAYMLLITALGTICSIGVSFLASRTAVGFGRLLREQVFARVESFSMQEFNQFGAATLINRTTNDITQVQTVTFMIMRMMLMAPLMCIGGIIMAVSKDRPLSLVMGVAVPVIAGLIILILRGAIPLFRLMQVKLDKVNLVLRENLTGIRVIRAFDRISCEQRRFELANSDLTENAIRVNKLMASMMPSMMLVMNFTLIAIIWFGSIRIDTGGMQVGSLMAFIQYAMQIMISLLIFSMMFIMVPRASASAVRINEILETIPRITDPETIKTTGNQRGNLEFDNVTFSFPGAEEPAISHISFEARPGETTAFIGSTGSGKTALVSLIPRFYDVDSGSVKVDGVDVRELSQSDLRSRIGFVPQKSVLFSGTIADNIRYGKEEASEEEIRIAAATAQATEFISEMQDGFSSVIEQGGINISGGQKQRLSIARALVRRPEIYIFDDSFSALDFKTDARLRMALRKDTGDSTVLIIAQRVSTVMEADRIIVMNDGQIAGMGTHRELMDSCSVYREIVFSQLSEEELA